ncbi:aromatic ring-hydroxylating oxygenase subunit alpha [Paraburkholderia sediminicola]|uniref:aromatic ring-hydroxylating oxygenase subunit alpha n=1 Tax=Paraburkholderia sediminicola TaxID=458836 RepID=UPI000E75D182
MDGTLNNAMIDVDTDRGVFRVSRRAFTDTDVLESERTRIFDRCWLYLGHDSELPKNGSYLTRAVGGRNLIFNRDGKGQVRAFLNSCPHRGATVARERTGTAKNFVCSYHGWVFGADGQARDIPGADSYPEGFAEQTCNHLPAVPCLEQYRDFWFVCFDAGAEPLREYLAGAADYLDLIADHSEARMEVVGGTQEYSIRANWKLLVENSFDGYHAASTHVTYFDYLRNSHHGELSQSGVSGSAYDLGNGHAVVEYSAPWGRPVANWSPPWGERGRAEIDAVYARLVQKHGEARANRIARMNRNLVIFPNFAIIDIMSLTLRTIYPRTPGYMEVCAWSLAPAGENEWVRTNRLSNFLEFLGPGGFATPDDVEMLEQCQRSYSNSKEAAWNDISRGMQNDKPSLVDELQMRVFWTEWNEHLNAPAQQSAVVSGGVPMVRQVRSGS